MIIHHDDVMVGVILGTIFGGIFALLVGKWKGREEELIATVLAIFCIHFSWRFLF